MDNLLTCEVKVKDNGNEANEAFKDEADQGTQDEADEDTENCLRNPVIVKKILENFSSPELLKLSLVNKLWKSEARSVIRKRSGLIAYVKSEYDKLHPRGEEVDAFISDLKQMRPAPFSGINIQFYFDPHLDPFPIGAPDPFQDVELDLSFIKTLSVHLYGSWLKNMASPVVRLAKKLLQDCSGVLQELSLSISKEREDFIKKFLQDLTFPRLETLKLEDRYCSRNEVDRTIYEQYMKAMMSRAPNLKVLHSYWPINLMLSAVEGRAVMPVHGSTCVYIRFEDISEDVIGAIKLENILLAINDATFNFERFNRIAPRLLEQSCTTTLRSMRLDSVLAISLMNYGISFKNVKDLNMDINFSEMDNLEPQILEIIKNFDLNRIFPNLSEVVIAPSYGRTRISRDQISSFIQQANAVLREPMPDRAANVKELYLKQKNLSSLAAQFFVEMFRNIEILGVKTAVDAHDAVPFEYFWKHWVNLKELKVRGNMLRATGNLDSVFCGIFPEEVAELREKDEDYLKRVNIVPVMPALTCLKNLRVLSLHHKDWRYAPFQGDAGYLFSKVTPLLAFARQPALAVSLRVSSNMPLFSVENPPAITHLMPYVSVTSDRLKDDEWDRNG